MKQFHKYFLFAFLVAVACSNEEQQPADIGKDYMPLIVGNYQIYTVDETRYSENADPEELHYELMVDVYDSFPEVEGGYTYVIHRSKRDVETDPWQYLDTWSMRVNDLEAVVSEENIPFVKFELPVGNGKSWDGNKFNVAGEDDYEMKDVDQPYSVGDHAFEKTMRIDQENTEDLLFYDKRFEVFARDVGLIYKEVTDLEYCDDVDCFGQKEIKSGVIYKQAIASYGSE